MNEKTKTELSDAMREAKESLVAFRKICLPCDVDEVKTPYFHHEWSESLLYGVHNEAIEAFRESAKTQIVLRAFPLYCLTFPDPRRDFIVLIKNNSTLAKAKLKEIIKEYKDNPLLNANLVKIYEQSGDVFSADIKDCEGKVHNIRIEAFGKGSSIRGLANADRRPKIVICDDLQDREDAKSDTVQKSDWDWFLSDINFLGRKTRIFFIGNNLGEKCILERIILNKRYLNFKVKRIPILTPDGDSAWPEKESVEEIIQEKENFDKMGKVHIWLSEKMCQAVGEETQIFKNSYYHYFTPQLVHRIIQGCNMYATLDPASSKDKESCYRALVINAVDSDNKWNIVDVPFGRWDSVELLDIMFDKVVQWNLKYVGIEKGMYKQVFEPFLDREMASRNIFFKVVPIEHAKAGSKLERIKMLQPRFKTGNIWFPDHGKWGEDKKLITEDWVVEMKAELAGVTKDEIKSMYIDLVDALAMQEQIAKPPYRGGKKKKNQILQTQADSSYSVLGG